MTKRLNDVTPAEWDAVRKDIRESKTKLWLVGSQDANVTNCWDAMTSEWEKVEGLMEKARAKHGSAAYKSFYLEDKKPRGKAK